MSKFVVETAVGDLLKKMEAMTIKITEQTTLIETQNRKICEQSRVIQNLSLKFDRFMTSMDMDAAKKEIGETPETLTTLSEKEMTTEATVATSSLANETERARRAVERERSKSKRVTTVHKRERVTEKMDKESRIHNNTSESNESKQLMSVRISDKNKNVKISTSIQKGGNTQIATFQAVEKKKFLHVWSLHPDTTEDAIAEHVSAVCGTKAIKIEKLIPKTKRDYSSFMIGVPESKFENINNENSWPVNTQFNEWVWFRNFEKSTKTN